MDSKYIKRVVADEIRYYDKYDFRMTYEYYKEREGFLGVKEELYLEVLEEEFKRRKLDEKSLY